MVILENVLNVILKSFQAIATAVASTGVSDAVTAFMNLILKIAGNLGD